MPDPPVTEADPRPGRTEALAALLLVALSVVFVADHDAWTPDEPRVVELARSVADGPRAVPLLSGEPFLEQPPLYYWTAGFAYAAFGTTAATARGVSSLFGAGTLLVTYLFAARLRGRRAGALAAIALGLSFQFFWTAHRAVADSALAFFTACSAYAGLRGLTAQSPREATAGVLLAYVAASLAYLTKGVVGIGLSGFAFVATIIALRDPRALLRARLWAAPLIFLAITSPYHWQVYREWGSAGLHTLLVWNTLNRAVGMSGTPGHAGPWWYYLVLLPADLLPTTLFFAPAVVRLFANRRSLEASERFAYEVPLVWLGLGVAALSAAESKRELYAVPLFPAAAAVAGFWIEDLISGRVHDRYARLLLPRALALALCLLGLALPVAAYALELPMWTPAAGGLAVAAFAWGGAHLARGGRTGNGLAALASGAVLALAVGCATLVPWIDAHKALGPFLAEAGRRIPVERRVYVLAPDETASGAIPFYTGRPATPIGGVDELRRRIDAEHDVYVFVIDKWDDSPLFRSVASLGPKIVAARDEIGFGARLLRLLHFEAVPARRQG